MKKLVRLEYMHIFPAGKQNQHQDLGVCVLGGGGEGSSLLIFLEGVSCVTQEPLAFTTSCSAAILPP